MELLSRIRYRLRPLPLILAIAAFGVGALGTAIAMRYVDIPLIITGYQAKKVTVADLQQGLLKPVIMIDVRSPREYAEDRIGNSTLVPLTDIQGGSGVKKISSIVEKNVQGDRAKPTVVLYCTSGKRSVKAYKLLEETGLNIVVLAGGIDAWREAVSPAEDATVLSPIVIPAKKSKQNPPAQKSKGETKKCQADITYQNNAIACGANAMDISR